MLVPDSLNNPSCLHTLYDSLQNPVHMDLILLLEFLLLQVLHSCFQNFPWFISLSFSVDASLLPTLSTVDRDGYRFFEPGSRIVSLCSELLRELDADGFMSKEITSALFSQLMVLCLRAIREEADLPADSKTLTQEDEIERIDNFFAMYPPERQTRQELAEYLHCSQRQLIRKMQALYGVSFRQKLIASRMDLARYLLRSSDKSVNEISTAVGYADNAAFFRAFRQHAGMTPAQYRKEKGQR